MKTTLLTLAILSICLSAFGQAVKVSDLPAISIVAGEDLFHAYDMSQASSARSRKVTFAQVKAFLSHDVEITSGTLAGISSFVFGAPTVEDSIETSQTGFGWVDERFTLQTPVGAMQFYETGSPAEAVIYWPGKIVAGAMETALLTSNVDGALITTGTIPSGVMSASMYQPLRSFNNNLNDAGTHGLTYANTGPLSANEPTNPGMYFMAIEVTDNTTVAPNDLRGQIRTAAQMRTDLSVAQVVAAPATAGSTGTTGQIAYDADYFYVCVATNTWKRTALTTW